LSSVINDSKFKKIIDVIILDISKKNGIEFRRELGKGGYSKVYEIKYNTFILAAKIQILKENDSKEKIIIIEKEMNLIVNFYHINIIKTLKTIKNDISLKVKKKIIDKRNNTSIIKDVKETYYVYTFIIEKAYYFDLASYIYYFKNNFLLKQSNKNLKIKFINNVNSILIYNFIQQILSGIYYLKKSKYVTFDLKPENVVITSNLILKLIDFSLMGNVEETNKIKLLKSTFSIMGPEYYDNNFKINRENLEKFEIFSLGAIIYFLIFNINIYDNKYKHDRCFDKNKNIELLEKSIKNLKENKYYDQKLINFIEKCLNKNINDRLSINDCLEKENFLYEKDKKYNQIMHNNYNERIKIFSEFQKIDSIRKQIHKKKFLYKNQETKKEK
jgi:serine/threonine protein kinase